MRNFEYQRATSLEDALQLLRAVEGGKALAGGQSLIPLLKLDLAEPTRLVSLRDVAELRGIRREGEALVVGAGATHAQVAASREVQQALPALAALAGRIGDPQVRNVGTLGGSIAHADPAADYPAALLATDATVVTDRREIAAEDFFSGMFQTPLLADELVTAVRFPLPRAAAYVKFPHPASKFAVVGVMVARGPAGVRVAVTGAAPRVFRMAAFEAALETDFSPAALVGIPVASDELLSDEAASAEYRAHLVGVLARRAVAACG